MENLIVWLLLSVLILENTRCACGEVDCKKEPRCKVLTIHGLKTADCYDRKFYAFPKCVVTDVEVIELTFNRIRKVTKEDLSRFNYLKYLYLTDNLITNLDDDTFAGMGSLSSLDLSLNALTTVPSSIFRLPSLKTLRLGQNLNINIAETVQEARPITSPLTVLDVSLTSDTGSPLEFPDFGPMPFLVTLNITGNQYVSMAPRHVAGLCNLQMLINSNVSTEYDDLCDCWVINNWLKERRVMFAPFACPVKENKCSNRTVREEDVKSFAKCREMYEQILMPRRYRQCSDRTVSEEDEKSYVKCREMYEKILTARNLTRIGIGVGITLLVVAVAVCICCWIRRRRRNEKKPNAGNANNANETDDLELLKKLSFPENN